LDKYVKLPKKIFEQELKEIGIKAVEPIHAFMSIKSIHELKDEFLSLAWKESLNKFITIVELLESLWSSDEIEFAGDMIRGFDYYDGIIFEMFDTNPDNPRALFWGGRYNGLADIFGVKEGIPAIGFAPWDETMKLFLEGHNLLDEVIHKQAETIFIPLLDEAYFVDIQTIATNLRTDWKIVTVWLSTKKLWKAIQAAKKKNYTSVVVFGESEKSERLYILENLETGKQEKFMIE